MKFLLVSEVKPRKLFFDKILQGFILGGITFLSMPYSHANPKPNDLSSLENIKIENINETETIFKQSSLETENIDFSNFTTDNIIITQENSQPSEFELEETESEKEESGDRWIFKLQPYVTVPLSTYGNVTVRGRTVDYHLSLGETLDLLSFTASGRFEAWKGNFGLFFDGYYVSLRGGGIKQSNRLLQTSIESSLTFEQGIYDFGMTYHFGDTPTTENAQNEPSDQDFPLVWFEPIAGVRINAINSSVENTISFNNNFVNLPTVKFNVSQGRTWLEPMVGAKFGVQVSEPLTFWIRGDASGFGLAGETDLSWNILAGGDWKASKTTSFQFAYRFYEITYGNGSGNNAFEFNQSFNGPFLAVTFAF